MPEAAITNTIFYRDHRLTSSLIWTMRPSTLGLNSQLSCSKSSRLALLTSWFLGDFRSPWAWPPWVWLCSAVFGLLSGGGPSNSPRSNDFTRLCLSTEQINCYTMVDMSLGYILLLPVDPFKRFHIIKRNLLEKYPCFKDYQLLHRCDALTPNETFIVKLKKYP